MTSPLRQAQRRQRNRLRRRRAAIALSFAALLSALAGMVDVVGFLMAGDFVSFMSGNTTRLAVSIGDLDAQKALHLALLVAVFVAGNAGGAVLAHATGRRHSLLIGAVAALLALAAVVGIAGQFAAVLVTVFAMGAINVAAERVEGRAVGVTYVTGALSRFGRSLGRRMVGLREPGAAIDIVPWAGMLCGGVAGALSVTLVGQSALSIAAAFAGLLAVASTFIPARRRREYFAFPRPDTTSVLR